MSSLAHVCAGGLALVLLMDYVAWSGSTGVNRNPQSFHSQTSPALHVVDRTGKGDRLPSARESGQSKIQPVPAAPRRPLPSNIPVGCDPAFSPLTSSSQVNFTGRCLS
jgi:hypothetical protein